jgi:uncharacterized protein (DUF302 family)
MQQPSYGITVILDDDFDSAVLRTTEVLKTQGFGVLTDIDVQATMKKKLGVEHPRYRILGACNPSLAIQLLRAEPEAGLLLPCNVVVREADDGVRVSFVDPAAMFQVVGRDDLRALVEAVRGRLEAAADELRG